MVDYREILRLQSLGHNITQIAESLHSSRNTVREVERLADEKGIRWPLGEEVTNPRKRQILRSLPNYAPLFIGGAYCNIQLEVLSTMA